MNIKRILSTTLATVMAGTTLVSCSQPNLENLLPFNEEPKAGYTSDIEGAALTLYVDANAKDGGDGSVSSPFKTIPEAQAKIREIKSTDGLPAGGIRVLVKDGEYKITESLTFTEEDSGTEECPITYVSESEFGAVLTGGLVLTSSDFEPLSDEEKSALIDETARKMVVKTDLKKFGLTIDDWGEICPTASPQSALNQYDEVCTELEGEVFIDGVRQTIARYPNDENLRIERIVSHGSFAPYYGTNETAYEFSHGSSHDDPSATLIRNPEGSTFIFDSETQERMSKWSSVENIWMDGNPRFAWAFIKFPFEYLDVENREAKLKYASIFGVGIGGQYYMFNIYSELDVEGEYYLDRENGILYVYKTKNFDKAEIALSVSAENIIEINNASNLTFKGFSVCYTKASGVSANSCENVHIDNLLVSNIRNFGIGLNGIKCSVKNCEVTSIGGSGILVGGGNISTLTMSENLVYNNYIHECAVVDPVQCFSLSGLIGGTVSHNEICDTDYQAISFGAMTVFEYNEIYDVCRTGTDASALYMLGYYTGNIGSVFRYNYVHDIIGLNEGTFDVVGLYWDGSTSFWSAYGNIFENINGHAVQCGGGRGYVLENNIFINCKTSAFHSANDQAWVLYETKVDTDSWYTRVQPLISLLEITPELKDLYPVLANVDTRPLDEIEDPTDPNLFAYPVGEFKNNITYYTIDTEYGTVTNPLVIKTDDRTIEMNTELGNFANNYVIRNDMSDFPGYHNGDYTMAADALALELCPDFEPIPFNDIGRIK